MPVEKSVIGTKSDAGAHTATHAIHIHINASAVRSWDSKILEQ